MVLKSERVGVYDGLSVLGGNISMFFFVFVFFQAEDGIRDRFT